MSDSLWQRAYEARQTQLQKYIASISQDQEASRHSSLYVLGCATQLLATLLAVQQWPTNVKLDMMSMVKALQGVSANCEYNMDGTVKNWRPRSDNPAGWLILAGSTQPQLMHNEDTALQVVVKELETVHRTIQGCGKRIKEADAGAFTPEVESLDKALTSLCHGVNLWLREQPSKEDFVQRLADHTSLLSSDLDTLHTVIQFLELHAPTHLGANASDFDIIHLLNLLWRADHGLANAHDGFEQGVGGYSAWRSELLAPLNDLREVEAILQRAYESSPAERSTPLQWAYTAICSVQQHLQKHLESRMVPDKGLQLIHQKMVDKKKLNMPPSELLNACRRVQWHLLHYLPAYCSTTFLRPVLQDLEEARKELKAYTRKPSMDTEHLWRILNRSVDALQAADVRWSALPQPFKHVEIETCINLLNWILAALRPLRAAVGISQQDRTGDP